MTVNFHICSIYDLIYPYTGVKVHTAGQLNCRYFMIGSNPHCFRKNSKRMTQKFVRIFLFFFFIAIHCLKIILNHTGEPGTRQLFVRSELFVQTCCWKICHLPRRGN